MGRCKQCSYTWNDHRNQRKQTITFPKAGTYRVEISGDIPSIFFSDEGDKSKILTVSQWGDVAWESMNNAFAGCENLTVPAIDAPVLSSVTDIRGMFASATKFNQSINHWDVSKVTNMVGIFYKASSFNQPIGNWNVANVTDMDAMFNQAHSFNQAIGNWDMSKVVYMDGMLSSTSISTVNYDLLLQGWSENPKDFQKILP